MKTIRHAGQTHTSLTTPPTPGEPHEKSLVVYQGKGTPRENRIETGVTLYWLEGIGRWVSIPEE
jgi:hypothetical protein